MNKVYEVKSLFIKYIKGQPWKQDMLISTPNNEIQMINSISSQIDKIMYHETNIHVKKCKIEYSIENTNIVMQREITHYEDINQELFLWIESFRQSAFLAKWDATTSLNVLYSLLSDSLRSIVMNSADCEDVFDKLLRIKYPKENIPHYMQMLTRLRQANHLLIHEYFTYIKEITKRLTVSQNLTKAEVRRMEEFYFMQGLHPEVKIKFAAENISEIDDIYKRIINTEKALMSERSVVNVNFNPEKNKSPNKWCSLHKTNSHSNENCFTKQKTFEKDQTKGFKKPNSINNIECSVLPYLKIKDLSNKKFLALIDCGASESYIRSDLVNKLTNFNLVENTKEITIADGTIKKLNSHISLKLVIDDYPKSLDVKLNIFPNLNAQIILGNDFLQKYNCKIDFSNKTLSIDGKICKMNTKTHKSSEKTVKQIVNHTKKLDEILSEYKNAINPDKPIENVVFAIPLTSKEIPNVKPFRIPFYQHEILKKELNELEQKKIIKKSNSMYCSPCFIKPKYDNTARLLIDYRELNKNSQTMQYSFHAFLISLTNYQE